MIKPGIYNDLDIEAYHKDPALGSSGVRLMAKSPMTLKTARETPQKTKAMFEVGSAGHAAILQSDQFWDMVVVAPQSILAKNGAKSTKDYKEFEAYQKAAGKIVLVQKEADQVQAMAQSVMEHPNHLTAHGLLNYPGAIFEGSVFYKDPQFGFMCKVRPDIRIPDLKMLVDLKSCMDGSKREFKRAIWRNGYFIQAPWYITGINIAQDEVHYDKFVFLCVEKELPFLVSEYVMRPDYTMFVEGLKEIRRVLPIYAECLETGKWPGYPDKLVELEDSEVVYD